MSITVTSTTETPEQIQAAIAAAKGEKVEETKSAVESKDSAETADESETSEQDEAATSESDEVEETESEESEDGEEKESEDEPKQKKKSSYKRRIDKMAARISERDEKIAALERELYANRRGPAEDQTKVETSKQAETTSGKPNADDFETIGEYFEAVAEWKADQKIKAEKAAEAEKLKAESARTEAERIQKAHNDRVKQFMAKQTDYEAVVTEALEELGDVEFGPGFASLIQESENGPELFYELAKNPDELARINSLSYGAMSREIGKLEARLEARAQSKPEFKKSNAPQPIGTVKAQGSGVKKSIFDKGLSFAEYEKLRLAEMKKG